MDPKELALKYIDRVVFALVLLFVVYSFATEMTALQPAREKNDQVEELLQKIRTNKEQSSPRSFDPPKYAKEVKRPFETSELPAARSMPAWAFYRRIPIMRVIEEPTNTPVRRPAHAAPSITRVTPEMGRMVVEWAPDKQRSEHIECLAYRILRREEGGELTQVGEVRGDQQQLIDTTVRPNTMYWYQVVSVARSTVDLALPEADKAKPSALSGPHEAPSDIVINVLTVRAVDANGRILGEKGKAFLKVWKFDPEANDWGSPRTFWVEEDSPIQTEVRQGAETWTFTTGYHLKEVRVSTRQVERGSIQMEESTQEIVIIDDRNQERVLNDKEKATPTKPTGPPPAPGGTRGAAAPGGAKPAAATPTPAASGGDGATGEDSASGSGSSDSGSSDSGQGGQGGGRQGQGDGYFGGGRR